MKHTASTESLKLFCVALAAILVVLLVLAFVPLTSIAAVFRDLLLLAVFAAGCRLMVRP